jgi:hypothetical protein
MRTRYTYPLIVFLAFLSIQTCAANTKGPCDSSIYEQRAKELQQIVKADQDARKSMPLPAGTEVADLKRRMRVGEIFGEGCFKTAADFSAAALVYQHGNVPEHFFQTFIWSKRAVELGDESQKRLMAMGLDRYLVSSGKKQLFASQAYKLGSNGQCWCLQPVEKSFPDAKRLECMHRSLPQSFKWVDELNKGTKCPAASECPVVLSPSPAGTVPGFW